MSTNPITREFPWLPKSFRAREVVVNNQYLFTRYPLEEMIRQKLARLLASEAVNLCLKKTENPHAITYDLEVYVLTPEELARIVNEYAWKLNACVPTMLPPKS